jgi:hypothetical protein
LVVEEKSFVTSVVEFTSNNTLNRSPVGDE